MTNSFLLILVQTTNSWRFTENVLNTTTESESEIKRIFFAFIYIGQQQGTRSMFLITVHLLSSFASLRGFHFIRLCGLSKF